MAAKKKPSITTKRSPKVKSCCGAIRGHKPGCETLAVSDNDSSLFDDTPNPEPAAFITDVERVPATPQVADGAVIASMRGIEEALVKLAESVDSIKVILGSWVNEQRAAPAEKKPRKAKVDEPTAAKPKDPNEGNESSVDLSDPDPNPPKAKPATPPPPKDEAPAGPSVDEIRSHFLAYASRKGRDAAVALLQKFGASKMAEVPEAKLPAFYAALKAGG